MGSRGPPDGEGEGRDRRRNLFDCTRPLVPEPRAVGSPTPLCITAAAIRWISSSSRALDFGGFVTVRSETQRNRKKGWELGLGEPLVGLACWSVVVKLGGGIYIGLVWGLKSVSDSKKLETLQIGQLRKCYCYKPKLKS